MVASSQTEDDPVVAQEGVTRIHPVKIDTGLSKETVETLVKETLDDLVARTLTQIDSFNVKFQMKPPLTMRQLISF